MPGGPCMTALRGGPPEPGVRRPVLLADVGLELDDPAHPPGAVGPIRVAGVTNEARTEESGGGLERGPPDERDGLVQRIA